MVHETLSCSMHVSKTISANPVAAATAGCDTMNMGSLKAELTFPPKYSGGADASDGELDEETMILGTTPLAKPSLPAWTPPVASAPITAPARGVSSGGVGLGVPALRSAQVRRSTYRFFFHVRFANICTGKKLALPLLRNTVQLLANCDTQLSTFASAWIVCTISVWSGFCRGSYVLEMAILATELLTGVRGG